MKKIILLFSVVLIASCRIDDDAGQPVVKKFATFEIIANSPDHEMFEQALIDTGLDQVLDSDIYTVFAPTDAAFENIDISGLSTDELKKLLLNHIISDAALSTDLESGYIDTNAKDIEGHVINMHVNISGGITLNGMSTVTVADFEATNGVVHVVDKVVTIPDVTTFATADPNFSILADAFTREASFTYMNTLSRFDSPAPFTVFAPTNDAFADLLDEQDFNSLSDIPTATLESALNTHIVTDTNITSETIVSGALQTLGDEIIIDTAGDTIEDPNGRSSAILKFDIQAGNGVIHAIDKVLLSEL